MTSSPLEPQRGSMTKPRVSAQRATLGCDPFRFRTLKGFYKKASRGRGPRARDAISTERHLIRCLCRRSTSSGSFYATLSGLFLLCPSTQGGALRAYPGLWYRTPLGCPGILMVSGDQLDYDYIENWTDQMELEIIWRTGAAGRPRPRNGSVKRLGAPACAPDALAAPRAGSAGFQPAPPVGFTHGPARCRRSQPARGKTRSLQFAGIWLIAIVAALLPP